MDFVIEKFADDQNKLKSFKMKKVLNICEKYLSNREKKAIHISRVTLNHEITERINKYNESFELYEKRCLNDALHYIHTHSFSHGEIAVLCTVSA